MLRHDPEAVLDPAAVLLSACFGRENRFQLRELGDALTGESPVHAFVVRFFRRLDTFQQGSGDVSLQHSIQRFVLDTRGFEMIDANFLALWPRDRQLFIHVRR